MKEHDQHPALTKAIKQWAQLHMILLFGFCVITFALALRAVYLSIEAMDMLLDVQRRVIDLKQEVDSLNKDGNETKNANPNNKE